MDFRVGLIDSGCDAGPVSDGACFGLDGRPLGPLGPDPTGHGSRIAALLRRSDPAVELLVAQVFPGPGPTSATAIAAGIDWCLAAGATLLHLSLGLRVDRPVLAAAVARALAAGCLVVAATPARGGPVYPAAYPGVIRGTGDARCAPGELSRLGVATFGAHVGLGPGAPSRGRGASIGAAAVTGALLVAAWPGMAGADALAALATRARYHGPERRGAAARDAGGER